MEVGRKVLNEKAALALPLLQWRLHPLFMGQPSLDTRHLNFSARSMSHHPGQFKFSLIMHRHRRRHQQGDSNYSRKRMKIRVSSAVIIPYVKLNDVHFTR